MFRSRFATFGYAEGFAAMSASTMSRSEYPAAANARQITSVHAPAVSGGYPLT